MSDDKMKKDIDQMKADIRKLKETVERLDYELGMHRKMS